MSEVLGALVDGICRGGDERPQRTDEVTATLPGIIAMSGYGTFETSTDVRHTAAFGAKRTSASNLPNNRDL